MATANNDDISNNVGGRRKKHKKNKAMDLLNTIDKNAFMEHYTNECPADSYIPAILPAQDRVVVLGDIHGDLKLAEEMLEISGLARKNNAGTLTWCGGSTYAVQVGDQIDRCRPIGNMLCSNSKTTYNDEASDIKILNLYTELHKQAIREGGALISLMGNHELMNALGHLDYVSHAGLKEFEGYRDPDDPTKIFNNGKDARTYAFKPGNQFGKYLGCTRLPAVIIGSNIFVHAGIVDGLIRQVGLSGVNDFETINQAIRGWLLGLLETDYVKEIIDSSKYSMFWTRILGKIPPNVSLDNEICSNHIGNVLKMFNVDGIIIGHTPQSFIYSDDINATCGNKVWRVDNGSSAAFNKFDREFLTTGRVADSRRVQYLEILNDKVYNVCDKNGCKTPMKF